MYMCMQHDCTLLVLESTLVFQLILILEETYHLYNLHCIVNEEFQSHTSYGNKEVICAQNNYYYVHEVEMENLDLCKQGCVDAAECWYIVICHFDINVNILILCIEVYGLKLFISMILDYESTFAFTGIYSDGLKVKSISRFSLAELVCTNKLSSLPWARVVKSLLGCKLVAKSLINFVQEVYTPYQLVWCILTQYY